MNGLKATEKAQLPKYTYSTYRLEYVYRSQKKTEWDRSTGVR